MGNGAQGRLQVISESLSVLTRDSFLLRGDGTASYVPDRRRLALVKAVQRYENKISRTSGPPPLPDPDMHRQAPQ